MGTIPVIVKITTLDDQPISSAAFWGSALYLGVEDGASIKTSKVVKAVIRGSVFTITTMNSTYEFRLKGENLQIFNDQLYKKQIELSYELVKEI